MTQSATIERRRAVPLQVRNQLSDFDAMVETAVRLAGDGIADPSPFVAEAVALARDLTISPCELHPQDFDHRELMRLLRLLLEHAVKKAKAGKDAPAQFTAAHAKRMIRRRTCDCAKQVLSLSGRPVW